MINKINTFTLAALALISANTQAICTMEDLYGNWQIKYRSIKPQAVGVCNLEISESKGLTGGCTNLLMVQKVMSAGGVLAIWMPEE